MHLKKSHLAHSFWTLLSFESDTASAPVLSRDNEVSNVCTPQNLSRCSTSSGYCSATDHGYGCIFITFYILCSSIRMHKQLSLNSKILLQTKKFLHGSLHFMIQFVYLTLSSHYLFLSLSLCNLPRALQL